eukprot:gene7214-8378_t
MALRLVCGVLGFLVPFWKKSLVNRPIWVLQVLFLFRQTSDAGPVFGAKHKHNLRATSSVDRTPAKYTDIVDLLLSPQFELVNVLCSVTLVKETSGNNANISDLLVTFFEIHCKLRSNFLLTWAIDKEIECTSNSATLFRGLSTATRFLSAFYKRLGDSYLKYLLQPFVLDLCSRNFSFEIDPDKAGKDMDVKLNLERLITITQQLLDKILDSASVCPAVIRTILHHTQDKVAKKFPEMKTTVIGGFIFLRYICPSIVAPEVFGLIKDNPTTESRRGLVLVSKLLQNLANEMPFGGLKEEYMSYLNRFISNNSQRIHVFFNELANEPVDGNSPGKQSPSTKENRYRSKSESPPLKPVGSVQKLITTTKTSKLVFTDDMVTENLGALVTQLLDNKERIDSILAETLEGIELSKRLDTALAALKTSRSSTFFKAWGKKSNANTSTSSLGSQTVSGRSKKYASATSMSTSSIVIPKELRLEDLATTSDEDMLEATLACSIAELQAYYRHKLELKDIELKAAADDIAGLKRELEEYRTRSSLVRKLRDELEREKKARKEADLSLRRAYDSLKSLGHDIPTEASSHSSIRDDSFTDLTALVEETLEISSSASASSRSSKKKSASSTSLAGYIVKPVTASAGLAAQVEQSSSLQTLPAVVEGDMKRSTTTGSIADTTASQHSSHGDNDDDSGITPIDSKSSLKKSGGALGANHQHSRHDSSSEYQASELTSSESAAYDTETEDRIIQACVDGDLEEDDDGMDLLEFLREYGEKAAMASNSSSHSKSSSSHDDSSTEKKKQRSSSLFRHLSIGKSKKKKNTSPSTSSPIQVNESPSNHESS